MIAKISKGSDFSGIVKYILDKKKSTELIDAAGVRLKDHNSIIRSFKMQQQLNTRVSRVVGHISLDFSKQDSEKVDNKLMRIIAQDYMSQMGISDTQYIIGRHQDKEHPHMHILFNRINNNGRTITDKNDQVRSHKICRELTNKYNLYFATGKEKVKRYRLREPEKTKYYIYDSLSKNILLSKSWADLAERLKLDNIQIGFKTKGSTSQIEGVRFTANDISFSGSKIDKQFSYSKIEYSLKKENKFENQKEQPIKVNNEELKTSNSSSGFSTNLFHSSGSYYDAGEAEFRRRMLRKKKKGMIR